MIYDDGFVAKNNTTTLKSIEYEINENGCWVCTSHKRDKAGYAIVRRGGNIPYRIHRYVYQLENGQLTSDQVVMHLCDNPPCFNPTHLKAGSHADNVRDKVQKGRHCKGTENGSAKLTEVDVLAIRKDVRSHTTISKDYGVNRATIGQIKRRETWTHLK